MITFKPISDFNPGQIQKLIKTCYQDLIEYYPQEKNVLYRQWEKEDEVAFQHITTIGRHVQFSCLDGNPIGYFSWDRRQFPNGIIGQNCILPEYQWKGYGTIQINKIIDDLRKDNFKTLSVETGNHDFFIPAHKLYKKCGFKIVGKRKGKLFDIIQYKIDLNR